MESLCKKKKKKKNREKEMRKKKVEKSKIWNEPEAPLQFGEHETENMSNREGQDLCVYSILYRGNLDHKIP